MELNKEDRERLEKYPHSDKEEVKAAWQDGKHPKECVGKCRITSACGMITCHSCEWCIW